MPSPGCPDPGRDETSRCREVRRVRGPSARAALLGLASLVLLAGCATSGQSSAAAAWAEHDREWAARCPGRSLDGVCLGGGGP
jgi:hypothetical protein